MPNKIHPAWYAVAIPLAGILLAVLLVIWRKSAAPSGERFSAKAYCAAPANYMGNRYVIDGQIDAQLQWDPDAGRLIAVRMADGDRIPVLAKDSFRENLSVGQRYRMEILIDEGGLISLESIEKL